MKLLIKVPDKDSWPTQYRGREIGVEVDTVIFPDNTYWGVSALTPGAEILEVVDGVGTMKSEAAAETSLLSLIGGTPKRIAIEL